MHSVREVAIQTANDNADVDQFIEFIMPISEVRVYKYRAYLRNLRAWWLQKPFRDAVRSDLFAVWKTTDELKIEGVPACPRIRQDSGPPGLHRNLHFAHQLKRPLLWTMRSPSDSKRGRNHESDYVQKLVN